MTKREQLETERQVFDIYSGILVNNLTFQPGPAVPPVYDFDCPEYAVLRERYGLVKLAGKGTAFQRAKRLLHHFAPRLTHSSYYDNHVPCDALSLLEYSYERPDQGLPPEELQKYQQMFRDSLARLQTALEEPCYDPSMMAAPPSDRRAV